MGEGNQKAQLLQSPKFPPKPVRKRRVSLKRREKSGGENGTGLALPPSGPEGGRAEVGKKNFLRCSLFSRSILVEKRHELTFSVRYRAAGGFVEKKIKLNTPKRHISTATEKEEE